MRRTISRRSIAPLAATVATLLLAAGCGDVEVTAKDDSKKPDKAATADAAEAPDTSAGKGNWLLGITSAGGADAETSTTVYLSLNPSTGQATAHSLPGVTAASATPQQAALLVSADRLWAIPDTGIARAEEKSGQLKVYSLGDGAAKVIDIRERAGKDDVDPIGWAFDPARADTLRVVDTKNRVWAVNVAGGKATQESTLPTGPWVFTNGFNTNTGQPWVESIDSDETMPPGNGTADTSPVTRAGGTVLPAGSPGFSKLPASPCRLGAGFTDAAGLTWGFCADDPSVKTYYLPKDGTEWTAYGKPSTALAPIAAGFPLVLPPA
jgi:hypothetical protein